MSSYEDTNDINMILFIQNWFYLLYKGYGGYESIVEWLCQLAVSCSFNLVYLPHFPFLLQKHWLYAAILTLGL
jgi:hypothetical protein